MPGSEHLGLSMTGVLGVAGSFVGRLIHRNSHSYGNLSVYDVVSPMIRDVTILQMMFSRQVHRLIALRKENFSHHVQ